MYREPHEGGFTRRHTACDRLVTLTNRRFGLGALASAYAAAGDRARAMVILRELRSRASREYVSPWQFAEAHLGLGDRDSTFAWLDSAFTAHDRFLLAALASPLWNPLRSDPRFARLRERLGLPRDSAAVTGPSSNPPVGWPVRLGLEGRRR
jgi:hypothetical protein